jgi:exocyst complex component 4
MDLLLCQAVRKIRYINWHGLTKMIRNILALQQNLRNLVVIHETSTTKARRGGTSNMTSKAQTNPTKNPQQQAQSRQSSSDGFEKSTKLWELIGKEPEEMLNWLKSMGPMHSFDDYRAALNLMLGIENGASLATATSPSIQQNGFNAAANSSGGPITPGAHLKPGTTNKISGDVSRQKLNEYRE